MINYPWRSRSQQQGMSLGCHQPGRRKRNWMYQWSGLLENLNMKPRFFAFFTIKDWGSCNFSHHPLLWLQLWFATRPKVIFSCIKLPPCLIGNRLTKCLGMSGLASIDAGPRCECHVQIISNLPCSTPKLSLCNLENAVWFSLGFDDFFPMDFLEEMVPTASGVSSPTALRNATEEDRGHAETAYATWSRWCIFNDLFCCCLGVVFLK